VSVKNGPIDFQPREPFHPLFGAMPGTPLLLELEITQEYIGHQMHLVYLGEQWEEFFRSDTYAKGTGSTTEKVVDGSLFGSPMTGILGTANTGTDRNWCGHDFAQANWYAFGRFAWNPGASTDEIADDWVRMTWSNDDAVVKAIKSMMMGSWETFIRYDCPLGLPFLQQLTSHYNPDPKNRTKFIGLDETGIGLDRTESGNNMVGEYFPEARGQFLDMNDLRWLLWFHHVEWGQKLATGRTLWDELCWQYDEGVHGAEGMQAKWEAIKGSVDDERWQAVAGRLSRQVADGKDWRDYCLRFFHTYSRIPLPADVAEQGPMEPPKAKKDQEP